MNTDNPEKIYGFYQEFPFLYRLVRPELVRKVRVQRWDSEMLGLYPCSSMHSEAPLKYHDIFLLNNEGDTIAIVGDREITWWNPFSWTGKVIERLVDKIPVMEEQASKVKLIVIFSYGLGEGDVLTIYKPPVGFDNLKDWFNHEVTVSAMNARAALV